MSRIPDASAAAALVESTMILRRAVPGDLDWFQDMVYDPTVYSQWLADPMVVFYQVAGLLSGNSDKYPEGTAYVAIHRNDGVRIGGAVVVGNEFCFFVAPSYRKLGFGLQLVEEICRATGKAAGTNSFRVRVLRSNLASRKILEKLAFHFAGLRSVHWGLHNGGFAVLEYTKRLC